MASKETRLAAAAAETGKLMEPVNEKILSSTGKSGNGKSDGDYNADSIKVLGGMEAVRKRIKDQGIHLRGAGADEAPEVYKRLPEVLAYHGDTVRVLHYLDPLIVCMAGADEFDPYKD